MEGSLHILLDNKHAKETNAGLAGTEWERVGGMRASRSIGPPIADASAPSSWSQESGPNTPGDEIDPFLQMQM